METKAFEVRDRMTCIPVMATAMLPHAESDSPSAIGHAESERYLLRKLGYTFADVARDPITVFMARLDGSKASIEPWTWGNDVATLRVAHEYIASHWMLLKSGDVIDCEYIRGETTTIKQPERLSLGDLLSTELQQQRGHHGV